MVRGHLRALDHSTVTAAARARAGSRACSARHRRAPGAARRRKSATPPVVAEPQEAPKVAVQRAVIELKIHGQEKSLGCIAQ